MTQTLEKRKAFFALSSYFSEKTVRWMAIVWLVLCGGVTGGLTLAFTAKANSALPAWDIFTSYFSNVTLVLLNLLPPVLLSLLLFFLSRRVFVGVMGNIFFLAIAIINFYKIQLRGDPLIAQDVRLLGEAGNISKQYALEITPLVLLAVLCFLFCVGIGALCFGKVTMAGVPRFAGVTLCGVFFALCVYLPMNETVYQQTANETHINIWSQSQVYCSRGATVSFFHSIPSARSVAPAEYDKAAVENLLSQYPAATIAQDKKVNVMGIMLEAFSDLTQFSALSQDAGVQAIYAPWHEMQSQSISGNLLTNIFAGGTVDSEWSFLTGFPAYEDFTQEVTAYPWYFKQQGYLTQGSHPGFEWFYDRKSVNQNLGFSEYYFSENYYHQFVEPVSAQWNSDDVLVTHALKRFQETIADGMPAFSFSVSYQNHGPYDWDKSNYSHLANGAKLTQESRAVLNNYLNGIKRTIASMQTLQENLAAMDEPVVLVLFGDHKPWLGNGNSVYFDLGETLDLGTMGGFYSYYATPYLIWANDSAKAALGKEFTGDGGDFSPCFLMNRLFDACGWDAPPFMAISNELYETTPLVHQSKRYLQAGALSTMPPDALALQRVAHVVHYFQTRSNTYQ